MPGHPLFAKFTEEELALHEAKNRDYTAGGKGDPLGNFKRVASILALYPGLDTASPVVVALVYALKQLDSVFQMLANHYEGKVETIGTRLMDVSIYAKLARILAEEHFTPYITPKE